MSFQIRPLKEFLVKPALPPALNRLPELGLNLMWSWHHPQRAVFRRLDPTIWKASNHNPVVMLARVPQESLDRALPFHELVLDRGKHPGVEILDDRRRQVLPTRHGRRF